MPRRAGQWPRQRASRRCWPRRTTIAPSGSDARDRAGQADRAQRRRSAGAGPARPRPARLGAGRDLVGECLQRGDSMSWSGPASVCTWQPSGPGRWAGRGRRRTTPASGRRPGSGARAPASCAVGLLGQVGEPVDGRDARRRAPAGPGTSRPAPGRRSRPRSGSPPRRPRSRQRRPAEQEHARLAAAQRPSRRPRRRAVGRRRAGGRRRPAAAGCAPSPQETSAGRISVATWPGGPAAATARSGVAGHVARCVPRVCTQPDTVRARARCRTPAGRRSGAWYVACSPTMLTTGVRARRALCRLARPLARPGPRCSSVAAGRPAIRAYPSAAPVATPSNRRQHPAHRGHRVQRGRRSASRTCPGWRSTRRHPRRSGWRREPGRQSWRTAQCHRSIVG